MKAGLACAQHLAEAASLLQEDKWSKALVSADRGMALSAVGSPAYCLFGLYASMALIHVGDLYRADDEVRGFLAEAASSPVLRRLEGDGWWTLARLSQLQHRNGDERDALSKAVGAYEREGRMAQGLACRCQLAWSLMLNGQVSEAAPVLEGASALAADHGYLALDVDLRLVTALLWSLTGNADAADDCCTDLLSRVDLSHRQRADVFWLLGSNALARQDDESAAEYLAEAEAAACRHWWPAQLERVEDLRRRCRDTDSARLCVM